MNILFVSTAGHFGGTERWAAMAIGELSKRHQVWMCCPDLPHAAKFAGPDRLVHAPLTWHLDRRSWRIVERTLRERDIDVVVPVSRRAYFMSGVIARRLGRACVVRLGIVRHAWKPVWDWLVYGHLPHGVVVNTARIKRAITRLPWVPADKVTVIHNGIVPPPDATPAPREPDTFTIATVGTLSRRKGMEFLIRAVSLLPAEARARVRLAIVGGGPARARLERLARRLGLDRQVRFTGEVANPAPLVAGADLFALLSSNEGISNAMLEAMSLATPVYVTLAGGHGEVIGDRDNGYVAASRSPARVAADLEAIMADAERQAVGRRGQATARERFSLARMGAELETYLETCIARAGRRAATGPVTSRARGG